METKQNKVLAVRAERRTREVIVVDKKGARYRLIKHVNYQELDGRVTSVRMKCLNLATRHYHYFFDDQVTLAPIATRSWEPSVSLRKSPDNAYWRRIYVQNVNARA